MKNYHRGLYFLEKLFESHFLIFIYARAKYFFRVVFSEFGKIDQFGVKI